MSVGPIHNAPIVQLGYVEKIVEDSQNQPLAGQALAHEMTQKSLERGKEQVPVVDKQDPLLKTNADEERQKGKNQEKKQQKKRYEAAAEAEDFSATPADNPWAGIIVNKKV